MTRKFSFYLLLAIVLVTGFVFFRVMANFVIPLFLAAVLVVIFRPVQSWITERCRDRARLAAAPWKVCGYIWRPGHSGPPVRSVIP